SQALRDLNAAIEFFTAAGETQALGRAWWLIGEIENDSGQAASSRPAFEHAARYAQEAGDLRYEANARVELASVDRDGPTPVREALRTAIDLLDWSRSSGQLLIEATALANLGRLKAM